MLTVTIIPGVRRYPLEQPRALDAAFKRWGESAVYVKPNRRPPKESPDNGGGATPMRMAANG